MLLRRTSCKRFLRSLKFWNVSQNGGTIPWILFADPAKAYLEMVTLSMMCMLATLNMLLPFTVLHMQELYTLMDLYQESEFNIDEVAKVLELPPSPPHGPNYEVIHGGAVVFI